MGIAIAWHAMGGPAGVGNAQGGSGGLDGQCIAQALHLAYIGDAEVGEDVNVGAGTITCNYDGANKHRTTIGDRAFIGSGSMLVAPIEIGEGATVGAGSTLTKNAPPDKLTLERSKQLTLDGWKRPVKKT